MKASDLVKKERSIKDIYEQIKMSNESSCFKTFIPHDVYVTEKTILTLMENGFKVYKGNWDNIMINVYIIEW